MSDAEHRFEFVMPFVVCQSQGGPYEDQAFCAGWELGAFDNDLEHHRGPAVLANVRTLSLPQVDLIAMRRGFTFVTGVGDEHWTPVLLNRMTAP